MKTIYSMCLFYRDNKTNIKKTFNHDIQQPEKPTETARGGIAAPISAQEAERTAEAITRGPDDPSKCGLPEHWRKVWRENGIKGVTVRNNRGGYSYHFTFTFRMMPGDVMPEAEALRYLGAIPATFGDIVRD